jgi:hypothetical protein
MFNIAIDALQRMVQAAKISFPVSISIKIRETIVAIYAVCI